MLNPLASFFIILLSVLAYGLVHSLLASLRLKRMAQRAFGSLYDRGYRLTYNAFAGLSLLPVLALVPALPDRSIYAIPSPWVLLSSAFQVLAVIALFVGLQQTGVWSFLGFKQLFITPSEAPSPLVIKGLYRWVRHPLYTAGLIFIWLTPVMTLNLLALNLGLTSYILIGAYFEERKLVREFGQAYRCYQRTTPMLFPRLSRKATSKDFIAGA